MTGRDQNICLKKTERMREKKRGKELRSFQGAKRDRNNVRKGWVRRGVYGIDWREKRCVNDGD